jgi:DNA-binding transcriptional LysR family regulator
MKIDTLGVQAFIAIADQGSFSRAASALNVTQTALSRRLQNLEAQLGVKLLERTTRSVSLSALGRDFLPRAQRLLDELALALLEIRETGKSLRGDVTIACVPTVGVVFLPRVVQQYSAQYPANRIRILDHASFDVAAAVLRREAEFGIGMEGLHDPSLSSVPLLDDRFVLACHAEHPLARHKRLAWKQLEAHTLILPGQASGNRALLDRTLQQQPLKLLSFYEVQHSSTALGMAAAGVGAAVVPALAMRPGTDAQLRTIALVEPVVSRTLVLLTRVNAQLTPAAQALYDAIRATAVSRRRGA